MRGVQSFFLLLEEEELEENLVVRKFRITGADEKWKRKRKTWSFENGCWQVKIVIIFYRR